MADLDLLARELASWFPHADDRCPETGPGGRRCTRVAWHTGGPAAWGEDTPHAFGNHPDPEGAAR